LTQPQSWRKIGRNLELSHCGSQGEEIPYNYELDFSDRVEPNTTVPQTIGFDLRTDGSFTTGAVPQPATLSLLALVAVPALLRRR
jgi:hypothetical protein